MDYRKRMLLSLLLSECILPGNVCCPLDASDTLTIRPRSLERLSLVATTFFFWRFVGTPSFRARHALASLTCGANMFDKEDGITRSGGREKKPVNGFSLRMLTVSSADVTSLVVPRLRSSANNLLEEAEDQLGGLPGDKKVVCYRCR